MKKIFCVITGIFLFSLFIYARDSSPDSIRLSAQEHLVLARKKLQGLDNLEDLPASDRACGMIDEALLKYRQYEYGFEQTENEEDQKPYQEAGQLEENPLSPAEHLYIAGDAMVQIRAGIMVSSTSLTQEQSHGLQALTESVRLVDDALKQLEATDLPRVHWMPEARMIISVPPDFAWRSPLDSELLRLVRSGADEEPTALFYIRRIPEEDRFIAGEEGYIESRIEKARERFPDMKVVERGTFMRGEEASTDSFTYEYTWEGELIRSFVLVNADGGLAIEFNFAAPSDIFDKKEAMAIIDSLKRI